MLIKPFTAKFSNIGHQQFLRSDPKYRHFWDNEKGRAIKQNLCEETKLKEVLSPYKKKTITKDKFSEKSILLELSDVEPRTSIILNELEVDEIGSTKLDFDDCDLVFARLRSYLGKVVVNDPMKKYVGTTEWIPLKVNERKIQKLFLKYLLLLPDFLRSFNYLSYGKEHPRIQEVDLRNMIIPLPPIETIQKDIVEIIKNHQEKMIKIHNSLGDINQAINYDLHTEFSFSIQKFDELSKTMIYEKLFSNFNKSILIKSSPKFHHPKFCYLNEFLNMQNCVKLKQLLINGQTIHKGSSIQYDNNGTIMVLKTINLKNHFIDYSNLVYTTEEFLENHPNTKVIKNNILASCHGEGRGKFDLFDKDEEAVIDLNTAIIPVDPNKINVQYCTYFLESIFGKYQFELLESETKAVRYIKPESLEQMKIILPSNDVQNEIVTKISLLVNEILSQKKEIKEIRDKIDSEIEKLFFISV